VGTYAVCAFGFNRLPVGQDMKVRVNVTTPQAFSPVPAPAAATAGPIKIISGKCNNLPAALPSPSELTTQWWTCGNYAYNVNFVLQPPAHNMSASGGAALSTRSSSTQPTLLSNTPSRGMLEGGAAAAQGPASVTGQSHGLGTAGSALATAPSSLPAKIQTTSTKNIGPGQAMSFQSAPSVVTTAPPAGTALLSSAMPTQTAVACGKDPSFRILWVTGTIYNSFTKSGKYTIWGCSFGSVGNAKAPPTAPRTQTRTAIPSTATNPQQANYVILYGGGSWPPFVLGATVNAWSDNSITISFPNPPQSLWRWIPAQLWVVRSDGKTTAQDGYNFAFW